MVSLNCYRFKRPVMYMWTMLMAPDGPQPLGPPAVAAMDARQQTSVSEASIMARRVRLTLLDRNGFAIYAVTVIRPGKV
jgi:hypothetical protein